MIDWHYKLYKTFMFLDQARKDEVVQLNKRSANTLLYYYAIIHEYKLLYVDTETSVTKVIQLDYNEPALTARMDLIFYLSDKETICCGSPYSLIRDPIEKLTAQQCEAVLRYWQPLVQAVAQSIALRKLLKHLGQEEINQVGIDIPEV